jgi:hypothetical protein
VGFVERRFLTTTTFAGGAVIEPVVQFVSVPNIASSFVGDVCRSIFRFPAVGGVNPRMSIQKAMS